MMSVNVKDLERAIKADLVDYFGDELVDCNMDGNEDILVEFVTLGREELIPLKLEELSDLTDETYYTGVGVLYDDLSDREFVISTIHTDDDENRLLALVEIVNDDEVELIKKYY